MTDAANAGESDDSRVDTTANAHRANSQPTHSLIPPVKNTERHQPTPKPSQLAARVALVFDKDHRLRRRGSQEVVQQFPSGRVERRIQTGFDDDDSDTFLEDKIERRRMTSRSAGSSGGSPLNRTVPETGSRDGSLDRSSTHRAVTPSHVTENVADGRGGRGKEREVRQKSQTSPNAQSPRRSQRFKDTRSSTSARGSNPLMPNTAEAEVDELTEPNDLVQRLKSPDGGDDFEEDMDEDAIAAQRAAMKEEREHRTQEQREAQAAREALQVVRETQAIPGEAQVFANAQTPKARQRGKENQPTGTPTPSTPSRQQGSSPRRKRTHVESEDPISSEDEMVDERRETYRASRSLSPKKHNRYCTGHNRRRSRQPWTNEETKCLMDSMDRLLAPVDDEGDGAILIYATILRWHGAKGAESQILAARNNVQLKDKVRNEILRLRRSNLPVSVAFFCLPCPRC